MKDSCVRGLAAVVLTAGVLCAQAPKRLTSVAMWKVAPDKVEAFVTKTKAITPVLDKLMTSGEVVAYGIDVDLLHVPDATNIALWIDVPDFSALGKLQNSIEEFGKTNAATMTDLRGLADGPSHHDLVMRQIEGKGKPAQAGARPISDFDQVQVVAGRMGEFLELFRKYDKPVYEKLVDDGVILAYSLETEAVHTMKPGAVWTIVTMADLGAKDKVRAAFNQAGEKMTEAERNLIDKVYEGLVEPGSHRDSLAKSVVFKSK
jgi:hypothetical protein